MTWCDISTVSLTLSKICLCIEKCFRDISRDSDVYNCHSRNEGILVMSVWWGLGCYGYELWLWGSFMNRLQFYLLNHLSTVFNHEQRHTWEQCSLWFIILMTHVVHYSNKKVITLQCNEERSKEVSLKGLCMQHVTYLMLFLHVRAQNAAYTLFIYVQDMQVYFNWYDFIALNYSTFCQCLD